MKQNVDSINHAKQLNINLRHFHNLDLKKKLEINHSKELARIDLSYLCKSIILGSLLGHGSLSVPATNAIFSIETSLVQREYFEWKATQLKEISVAAQPDRTLAELKLGNNHKNCQIKNGTKLKYTSAALPSLTIIYKHSYKAKKLNIRRYWLNCLTPISLMIWWLDNGRLVGGGRKGVINTAGLSELGVKRLARYLYVVWNITVSVGYNRLWFNTNELKKFLRLFLGYIPVQSLLNNVSLRYKDALFQQRWISEIKAALLATNNQLVKT